VSLMKRPSASEGNKLEVAVKSGRWALTHLPPGPRPAAELARGWMLNAVR
jgi:hypothetical protein